MKSYLSDRRHYVQIYTFNSNITETEPCSVIQGGKLSGTLYSLYTNEVPILHKLLVNQNGKYTKIQKNCKKKPKTNKNIKHETINFVDDSTSVIGFYETNYIKDYLTDYYKVLDDFYTSNRLKINPDKTKFLINCKPKHSNTLKNVFFMAGPYKIKPLNSIKILGVYIQSN